MHTAYTSEKDEERQEGPKRWREMPCVGNGDARMEKLGEDIG